MTRIRINTHPAYEYSNVIVLDYCQALRNLVSENRDDYLWAGERPPQIMVSAANGRDRWGNLEKLVAACLESKCEVKARRERTDEWVTIKDIEALQPLKEEAPPEEATSNKINMNITTVEQLRTELAENEKWYNERLKRFPADSGRLELYFEFHAKRMVLGNNIEIAENGGTAWFEEYSTLDNKLLEHYVFEGQYGERTVVRMPDGSKVYTNAKTKRGLEKHGLKMVRCMRPAWSRWNTLCRDGDGVIEVYPDSYNHITGEIASRYPLEIEWDFMEKSKEIALMGKLSTRAADLLTEMYKRFKAGEYPYNYSAEDSKAVRELREAWLVETDCSPVGLSGAVLSITPYGNQRARQLLKTQQR